MSLSDEALVLARARGDSRTLVDVLASHSVTVWSPATLTTSLDQNPRITGFRSVLALLLPFEDQVAYTGAGGWGLVEHYVGMLEHARGRYPQARARLEHAARRAELLPAPLWAEQSRLEVARAMINGGEAIRAGRLLVEVCAAAEFLQARSIAREAGELLSAGASSMPSAAAWQRPPAS